MTESLNRIVRSFSFLFIRANERTYKKYLMSLDLEIFLSNCIKSWVSTSSNFITWY